MFSNTFAGIAPSSAWVFIAAQIGGGIAGVVIIRFLYPALTPAQAASAVVPREDGSSVPREDGTGLAAADGARRVPPRAAG
jgi:arsenate reductase